MASPILCAWSNALHIYSIFKPGRFAMPVAISVNKTTGEIIGNQRSAQLSEGDVVDAAESWIVTLTDAQESAFRIKRHSARTDGLESAVHYDINTKVFSIPADARPILAFQSDKRRLSADGLDKATIVVTVSPATTDPVKAFLGEEYFLLDFVNGEATITYSTVTSGRFIIRSTKDFKVATPFVLHAFKV
jgi:hypothetical protein